jgi:hypothetical protein
MIHRILTCKNHPDRRWSCKDIAVNLDGSYNGMRSLFYTGVPTGEGMYSDGSGLHCSVIHPETKQVVEECNCSTSDLILAPEDALVVRRP